MKNKSIHFYIIIFVVITFLITTLFIKKENPKIYATNSTINVGALSKNKESSQVEFEIYNKGNSLLRIDKLFARCSCLNLRINKTQLEPNEKAIITATLSPRKIPGPWSEYLYIFSNDPVDSKLKLLINGYTERLCDIIPSKIIVEDLGYGETRPIDVIVYGPYGENSFKIEDIETSVNYIEFIDMEKHIYAANKNREAWKLFFRIKYRGQKQWEERIKLATNTSKDPIIKIPVIVQERQAFYAIPSAIIFRYSPKNSLNTKGIELFMSDGDLSKIEAPSWLTITKRESNKNNKIFLEAKLVTSYNFDNSIIKGVINVWKNNSSEPLSIPVAVISAS